MRYRNQKIIIFILIGSLLAGSSVLAKNFTIYNSTNINLPYFSVNGTTGNVGIGLTSPTTPLQLLNNSWISAQNSLGTGTINMFKVNSSNQIEVGAPLNIGSFEFSPDSGLVTFVDMPVTSAVASGTSESYVFKVDGDNIMTVYSEANGLGGIQNKRVGIGTLTPKGALDILGGLSMGTYAGVNTPPANGIIVSGNVGIGTTAPNDDFSIGSAGVAAPAGSADTGHNYTSSYLGTDNYALANYGLVKSLISSATSTITLWGGTTANNIWSLNTGNVGVGTISPISKLSLSDTVNPTLSIYNSTDNNFEQGRIRFLETSATTFLGGFIHFDGLNNILKIGVHNASDALPASDVNAISIPRSNGYVGVGITNPSYKLDVAGDINTSGYMRTQGIRIGSVRSENVMTVNFPNGVAQQAVDIILPSGTYFWGSIQFNITGTYSWINGTGRYTPRWSGGMNPGGALYDSQWEVESDQGLTANLVQLSGPFWDAANTRWYFTLKHRTSAGNDYFIHAVGITAGAGALNGFENMTKSAVYVYSGGIPDRDNWNLNNGNMMFNKTGNMLTVTGKIGIGTTAPNDKLSIASGGIAAPAGSADTGHNYTNSYLGTDNYALTNYGLVKTLIGNATSSMTTLWGGTTVGNVWNLNTGNVGIGTTNPYNVLNVSTNNADGIRIARNSDVGIAIGDYEQLLFTNRTNDYGSAIRSISTANVGSFLNPRLGFFTQDTNTNALSSLNERMSILSGGNVGIGTTNPSQTLEVNGTFMQNSSGIGRNITLSNGSGIAATNHLVLTALASYLSLNSPTNSITYNANAGHIFSNGNGTIEWMRISSSGKVGIGTTAPNDKLSIGSGGLSAPAGSADTGHNYTSTYLGSDDYALTNYGLVRSLIGSATSSMSTLWGGTIGGNVWSLNSGNIGINTSTPLFKFDINGSFRALSANISNLVGGVVMADASGNLYATSTLPSGYSGNSVFVGPSATSTTGNNNGNAGYDATYAYCETDYPGSHVCTPDDMLNNIKSGSIYPNVNVWIFSGPPGYTASANDCNGRRGAASSDLGAYWEGLTGSFPKGRGLLMACNQSLKIACCR